jgi:hypothetical protein
MVPPGDWHNRIKNVEDAESDKTLESPDTPKLPSGDWINQITPSEDSEKEETEKKD